MIGFYWVAEHAVEPIFLPERAFATEDAVALEGQGTFPFAPGFCHVGGSLGPDDKMHVIRHERIVAHIPTDFFQCSEAFQHQVAAYISLKWSEALPCIQILLDGHKIFALELVEFLARWCDCRK